MVAQDVSVDPVAEAVPRMLFSSGGRLVLADPALRTRHNRRAAALCESQNNAASTSQRACSGCLARSSVGHGRRLMPW